MEDRHFSAPSIGAEKKGVVKDEQTPLSAFCEGDFADLKPVFGKLRVEHLRGFTEATFLTEVEKKGGDTMLARAFLLQTLDSGKSLESFLHVPPGPVAAEPELKRVKLVSLGTEQAGISADGAPSLRLFDVSLLCPVEDVKVPPIAPTAPPFTAEPGWLEKTVQTALRYYEAEDGDERVPPMALVRCSRGGKTRALLELARALKAKGIPVIMITLNDYSSLMQWEKADGVGAVCRRIAFAASRDRDFKQSPEQYESFVEHQWMVTDRQVKAWLGNHPCVLLIDELNNLPQSAGLADFLKKNFVSRANRYLVFSSHVLATTAELSQFMDASSGSKRGVALQQLPLVPSLQEAALNFNWPSLNAREVLFYGMVPALIHEAQLDASVSNGHLPAAKRDLAISECLKDGTPPLDSICRLMGTFVTGDRHGLLQPLECLMTTRRDGTDFVVEWIPFHMMKALTRFSFENGLTSLQEIVRLFHAFRDDKESSGDGWESLFVAVLLIRCWAQMSDRCILPFDFEPPYTFSYNKPFLGDFATQSVEEFLAGIKEPASYPHVAVYHPSHASFQMYDVIVAHFEAPTVRSLYGYQLKEGRELPKESARPEFKGSFVIRGKAAKAPSMGKNWLRPSEKEIDVFFGVSGMHWTPQRWKSLRDGKELQ